MPTHWLKTFSMPLGAFHIPLWLLVKLPEFDGFYSEMWLHWVQYSRIQHVDYDYEYKSSYYKATVQPTSSSHFILFDAEIVKTFWYTWKRKYEEKKKHHRKILQKEYFIILNSHLLLWRHQTFILTAPVLTSLPCSVSSSLYRSLFKDSSRKSPLHSVALKLNHCPLSLKRIKKTPAGIHNHVS